MKSCLIQTTKMQHITCTLTEYVSVTRKLENVNCDTKMTQSVKV